MIPLLWVVARLGRPQPLHTPRRCPAPPAHPHIHQKQRFRWDTAARAGQPAVSQISQDAQQHTPTGDLLHGWLQRFGYCVYRVRTHRIQAIINQMYDQHRARRAGFKDTHFQVTRATTQPDYNRIHSRSLAQQALAICQQSLSPIPQVFYIQNLHLHNHLRSRRIRLKPTSVSRQPRCETGPGNDRRLLDDHWDQPVPSIHHEVRRNTQWQGNTPTTFSIMLIGQSVDRLSTNTRCSLSVRPIGICKLAPTFSQRFLIEAFQT